MLLKYEHSNVESFQQMLKEHKVDVQVIQTSKGAYSNTTSTFFLPTLRIVKNQRNISSTAVLHGKFSQNEFHLTIPLDNSFAKMNGVEISSNRLNILSPSESIHIATSLNSSNNTINIGISEESLEKYLGMDEVSILLNNSAFIRTQTNYSPEFIQAQRDMSLYANSLFGAQTNYSLQALIDIEETLYIFIARLLSECTKEKRPYNKRFNKRLAIVQRSMEFIDSSPHIHINMASLLLHAFCSARSLEYAFQDILGISPKKYLVLRRMHLIKRDLLHNPGQKIKDVANRYGIVNLGRFANDFYALFGEYPKKILLKG